MSLWISDLLSTGPANTSVGVLAGPLETVAADLPVTDLDDRFRSDPRLTCVAVRPAHHAADSSNPPADAAGQGRAAGWGLLTRARFQQLMTGRLGYGRVLHARKTVQAMTDWSPLVVDAATDIADIARLVLEHDQAQVSDGAGAPGTAPQRGRTESPSATLLTVQATSAPTSVRPVWPSATSSWWTRTRSHVRCPWRRSSERCQRSWRSTP